MTELFFESPITLGLTGSLFTIMALVVWIKGGFGAALYSAIGLALGTIALVLLSLWTQTEREAIEMVLNDVASAVERNDLQAVLEHIHPGAVGGIHRAKVEFPSYHFSEARITGIKSVEVQGNSQPPSAIAEFYVAVSIASNNAQANGIRRFVRAYFVKRDGKWLVHDYQHFDPGQGMRSSESN